MQDTGVVNAVSTVQISIQKGTLRLRIVKKIL